MKVVGSILSQKEMIVRLTTRPQFLVVLTYFLVAEDARMLEFCMPAQHGEGDRGEPGGGGGGVQEMRHTIKKCKSKKM